METDVPPEMDIPPELLDLLKWLLKKDNQPRNVSREALEHYQAVATATEETLLFLTQFLLAYHTMGNDAFTYNKGLSTKLSFKPSNVDLQSLGGDQLVRLSEAIYDATNPHTTKVWRRE